MSERVEALAAQVRPHLRRELERLRALTIHMTDPVARGYLREAEEALVAFEELVGLASSSSGSGGVA